MGVIKIVAHLKTSTKAACLYNFIFIGTDGSKYSSKKIWVPKASVISSDIGWVELTDAFRFKVEKEVDEFHVNYKSLLIFKDEL